MEFVRLNKAKDDSELQFVLFSSFSSPRVGKR